MRPVTSIHSLEPSRFLPLLRALVPPACSICGTTPISTRSWLAPRCGRSPAARSRGSKRSYSGSFLLAAQSWYLRLATNVAAAALLAFAILFYVIVYTAWLKRLTPQNIVIGGAAGALPPVIGWAAATGEIGLEPLVLFLIIFLWTPPHFWALALNRTDEYARAGVPMLPVVAGRAATTRQILIYCALLALGFGAALGAWVCRRDLWRGRRHLRGDLPRARAAAAAGAARPTGALRIACSRSPSSTCSCCLRPS